VITVAGMRRRNALLWGVCSATAAVTARVAPAAAQDTATSGPRTLAAPTGAVLLSIGGRIRRTNQGPRADFDLPMLQALQQHSYTARTPWFAQRRKYSGPLLRDLLARVGAEGDTLRLAALNDYRIDIPADDARRFDVLVACALDDRAIGVRDKGPLLVIYPFDRDADLRNALYYSRSVWQLTTIDVL